MNTKPSSEINCDSCSLQKETNLSGIQIIKLVPDSLLQDYQATMKLADKKAQHELGEFMLLSWYDRDRDFESPQHSSESHQDSATPCYVDYGINHGAKLMIDIENGRFVFFYMPVNM